MEKVQMSAGDKILTGLPADNHSAGRRFGVRSWYKSVLIERLNRNELAVWRLAKLYSGRRAQERVLFLLYGFT